MKKAMYAVLTGLALTAVAGCGIFGSAEEPPPPDYPSINVMVREGASLKNIIAAAAAQRGWNVRDTGEDSLRLTIAQRSNLVEVNAVVLDPTHYALHLVSSNIPTRKYVQWIDNLQRTVTTLASIAL